MKTISQWRHLEEYGIVPLTGEACGLMYRILCDLTEHGQQIVEKCLGCGLTLPESWNRGTDAAPHVGAIMLAPEMLIPLGAFALLESGCREVWLVSQTLIGIESTDEDSEVELKRQFHQNNMQRRFAYAGTAGDRNVHMMTGRVH